MSTLEANMELLATIPEEKQKEIQAYLLLNFCEDNPFKPLSADEILAELAESRASYERGEGKDMEQMIAELEAKYDL